MLWFFSVHFERKARGKAIIKKYLKKNEKYLGTYLNLPQISTLKYSKGSERYV